MLRMVYSTQSAWMQRRSNFTDCVWRGCTAKCLDPKDHGQRVNTHALHDHLLDDNLDDLIVLRLTKNVSAQIDPPIVTRRSQMHVYIYFRNATSWGTLQKTSTNTCHMVISEWLSDGHAEIFAGREIWKRTHADQMKFLPNDVNFVKMHGMVFFAKRQYHTNEHFEMQW